MRQTSYTIAIAGNPNCGKTTLFNDLTGSRQRVGNWPGVTVERLEGAYRHGDADVRVVDLPGIYSFSALSVDESVARQYILTERPAVVVNVVDATNLERNLYLTVQLLELKAPVVLALNMMDLAEQRRLRIDVKHLSQHLGCPVVGIVASRGRGIDELRGTVARAAAEGRPSTTQVAYDREVEEAIDAIRRLAADVARQKRVDERWLAIKLLEKDELALGLAAGRSDLLDAAAKETARIEKHVGEEIDIIMADGRYGFIHGLTRDVVHRGHESRRSTTDAIDRIVLSRSLGIPIFLAAMYLMFMVTMSLSRPFIAFFDRLSGTVFVDGVGYVLTSWGAPAWLHAVLSDGVGGGLQTVSTFIAPVFFIFVCLSILEDSGYMARAAFIMDRPLRAVGLPGKAFLPLLVGFGCTVPAVMAARTLDHRRDRVLTMLINPLMSCGARLPVYAVFATAFFPGGGGGLLVFALYLTGIVLAVLTGLLLKHTILRGEAAVFVMELPAYHLPTVGGVLHHTWHNLKGFLIRAGRVIILAVLLLTMLNAVGTDGSFDVAGSDRSVLSVVGERVTPIFRPMGISDANWPASVGLVTGIFAKEAVIGTLDTLYPPEPTETSTASPGNAGGLYGNDEPAGSEAAADSTDVPLEFWHQVGDSFAELGRGFVELSSSLTDPVGIGQARSDAEQTDEHFVGSMQRHFGSQHAAVAYLLFILIYCPCVAAVAVIVREAGVGWATFSALYLTGLAWIVATVYYQLATLPEHPATSLMWLGICVGAIAMLYIGLRLKGRVVEA
jgi:ferrous iron transport protein B